MRETYELEIIFRNGAGIKRYPNVVEEFDMGIWHVVVLDEVTRTGNLRTMKHPTELIWSLATEHREHRGTTKVAATGDQE